ncbi:hypothetical protein GCM10010981_16240 [Dyella nitratireducens]|uniref:Secreted protein n=1 Tax=Dyella nitratireducens TaxID=1849580 RepID=A0ABQ1FSW3_9GAMM|nr:hypothetical protein GCM10010981_16240 [Dyella nitratireducens]GLQ43312.1 hypothetical protein GCM10007902_31620 [Dyella nitratireducens]
MATFLTVTVALGAAIPRRFASELCAKDTIGNAAAAAIDAVINRANISFLDFDTACMALPSPNVLRVSLCW